MSTKSSRLPHTRLFKQQICLFKQQNWLLSFAALLLIGCGGPQTSKTPSKSFSAPAALTYDILETHPHDSQSFTQGLVQTGNVMTESSGLYGKSFLMQYQVTDGALLRRIALPKDIFAEGVTLFEGQFYLLTWHAQKAYVFNEATLEEEKILTYTGEGWGITHDQKHLITSNGSNLLSFRNPNDFSVTKTLQVRDNQRTWDALNELEFADGLIWANVWQYPVILAIDPDSGQVRGIADFSQLDASNNRYPGQSVLNGIAYDASKEAYWITGKWWPYRYLVRFHWPDPLP